MQNSNEIIMIVPKLPPAIDGIGDYGLKLAHQLYRDLGWKTRFIVGTPEWQGETQGDFFQVAPVKSRSQTALLELLPAPPSAVLLHYAGHGYAKRGCPVWLVQALASWCRAGGRLLTMFHELYATGPLLSSALLTSPLQKQLAVQLMQLSDRAITNRHRYAEKIQALSRQKHSDVLSLPVFSNFGEISHPKPLHERSRELIIFGNAASRQGIYQQVEFLEQICQDLEIQAIVDIGAEIKLALNYFGSIPIRPLGIQSADQISQRMSDSIAGVVNYPTAYLAKSSVFAAYCSHGILPIVLSSRLLEQDGLEVNQHYWLANQPNRSLDLTQGQEIVSAAHAWYQSHSLKAQAQQFIQVLQVLDPSHLSSSCR